MHPLLSHGAVRLFAVIGRYARSDGSGAYPSRATLARGMNLMKPASIDPYIEELVDAGALRVTRRRKGKANSSNLYHLVFDPPSVGSPEKRTTPAEGAAPQPVDSTTGSPVHGTRNETQVNEKSPPCASHTPGAVLADGPRSRDSDHLFNAVVEGCELDSSRLTRTARGALNKVVKDICEVGATPAQVADAVAAYRRKWPAADCTPSALAKHWPSLTLAANKSSSKAAAERWARDTAQQLPADTREIALDRFDLSEADRQGVIAIYTSPAADEPRQPRACEASPPSSEPLGPSEGQRHGLEAIRSWDFLRSNP
jgi:hypothetical protein